MKNFFKRIADTLSRALGKGMDYTAAALPYIDLAADIGVGLTPSQVDDVALAAVKAKFPSLFDGTVRTGDELKLYLLGIAAELFRAKFPSISTTVARLAVQHAYAQRTLPAAE